MTTEPINLAHPTFCMRNCGCCNPRGHAGDCYLVGPLPRPGCICLTCAAAEPDPAIALVAEILESVGIVPDGLAERIVRELAEANR